MLKLTTDKHEASRGLSATAELLVVYDVMTYKLSQLLFTLSSWVELSSVAINTPLGDITNVSRYRGISLCPVISEHCLINKLQTFTDTWDLQFGFKKKIECSRVFVNVKCQWDHTVLSARGNRPAFTSTGQVGTRFIDPVKIKGWVGLVGLVTYRNGLPVHRRSPILVLTGSDVAQLRWSMPTRYH